MSTSNNKRETTILHLERSIVYQIILLCGWLSIGVDDYEEHEDELEIKGMIDL